MGDLSEVGRLLGDGKPATKEEYASLIESVSAILDRSLFDRINFKKAFNAFADNIYYSDPDRANLYLGGGAVPKNEQSIAYLVRNDVLTNIENLQAELAYLLKEDDGVEDLYNYADIAVGAMKKYMAIVPPKEL